MKLSLLTSSSCIASLSRLRRVSQQALRVGSLASGSSLLVLSLANCAALETHLAKGQDVDRDSRAEVGEPARSTTPTAAPERRTAEQDEDGRLESDEDGWGATPARPPSGARGPCAAAPAGLVSWWRGEFDATDVKRTNDGVPNGDVGYSVGVVGSAFRFDGTSYIMAAGNRLPVGAAERTIEGWFRTDGVRPGSADAIFAGYGTPAHTRMFWIGSEHGLPMASQWGDLVASSSVVSEGTWHHLAATVKGGVTLLYVDGRLRSSRAMPLATQASGAFYIGADPRAPLPEVAGLVGLADEVSVYDRALEAPEIAGIHAAASAGKCIAADD